MVRGALLGSLYAGAGSVVVGRRGFFFVGYLCICVADYNKIYY